MGPVIVCWDDQQNFHVEEEERHPQGREFSNIDFGYLGYDECWVQGMEEDAVGPASQPSKPILLLLLLLPLQLLIKLLIIKILFDASEIICLQE